MAAVGRFGGAGLRLAVISIALALAGVALAHFGLSPPFAGFLIYAFGLLCALIGAVASLVAVLRARSRVGSDAAPARRGLMLSLLMIAVLVGPALSSRDLPRINDITTDTEDPPAFVAARDDPANRGRDMAYPGPAMAEQQAAAYGDLRTTRLELPPEEVLSRLRETILALPGAEVVAFDPGQGRLEAKQTSWLFRFVDDVVVRVRPGAGPSSSLVDIRSKSRDGQGDLGKNAERIRTLLAALEG